VNVAERHLGAGVIAASDEFFGEKENLVRAGRSEFRPLAPLSRSSPCADMPQCLSRWWGL